jgi:uncharacterized protein (DUF2147 family)
MRVLAMLALIVFTATTALGARESEILGIWKTEKDDSKVEIFRCGSRICGKIVWLKKPAYTDSKEGVVGTPIIDRKNPDPALKSRPVLGLQILNDFTKKGDDTWANGTCYDPISGNTYKGKIHLAAPDRLELRGYIGIPLFGRSSVWTR